MPWNISASIRGSSARAGTLPPIGRPTNVSATSGHNLISGAGTLRQRHSSTVPPSPLIGRGTHALPSSSHGAGGDYDDPDPYLPQVDDPLSSSPAAAAAANPDVDHGQEMTTTQQNEYELFGTAAGVSTQLAGTASWNQAALEIEANNFLTFVKASIDRIFKVRDASHENKEQESQEGGEDVIEGRKEDDDVYLTKEIAFEMLLQPAENTRIVAAQGLLHVLSLGTKNLLRVKQAEHFGEIALSVI